MGEFQKLVRRFLERGGQNARIAAMATAVGGQIADIAQMMPEHPAQLFVLRIGGITHRRALANRNF